MHRRINRTFGGYCLKFRLLEHLSARRQQLRNWRWDQLFGCTGAGLGVACVDQIFPHSPNTFSWTKRKKANLFRKMICLLFLFHCAAGVLSSSTREYIAHSLSLCSLYVCYMCSYVPSSSNMVCFRICIGFSIELKLVNRIDRKLKLQYSINEVFFTAIIKQNPLSEVLSIQHLQNTICWCIGQTRARVLVM